MELSVSEFLDSVSSPNTKKEYRHGVKKFCWWFGNNAEEALSLRKVDVTQRQGINVKRNHPPPSHLKKAR